MRLVEVIPAMDTDPAYADEVSELLKSVGKTPIRVKDEVGFAVNRLLHAMVLDSIRLVEEGVCSAAAVVIACKLGLGDDALASHRGGNTPNGARGIERVEIWAPIIEPFARRVRSTGTGL
jgi:hypothetical protein